MIENYALKGRAGKRQNNDQRYIPTVQSREYDICDWCKSTRGKNVGKN